MSFKSILGLGADDSGQFITSHSTGEGGLLLGQGVGTFGAMVPSGEPVSIWT